MTSRGALGLASPRTRRRLALTWSVLFILSIVLQYAAFVTAPAALAVHADGLFELDGNAVSSAAVAGDDWDKVKAGTSAAEATKFVSDKVSSGDDIFTGGSTKDDHNTTDWLWKVGGVQDKNDITHAFAAGYTATSGTDAGDSIVYFGLNKFDASGDNFVGFWFLQGAVGPTGSGASPGSPFSGAHTPGDILVLADYTNGGAVSTFSVFQWVTSGGDAGTHLDTVATGVPCTGAPAFDDACGVTNTNTETAPWSFTDKSGSNDFLAGEFFEGGINLSDLKLDDGCFTSFIAETRSSQAVDATLSDFASGTFSFCVPPTIGTQVEQDGQSLGSLGSINLGESVQDTATLTGTKGTVTGSVDFFVCHGASAAPDCATGGDQVGGTKTLSGGTTTSASFKPGAAGFYCFRVEYTPAAGSKYLADTHTNKTTECFRVLPAQVTIAKTADGTTVSAGDDVGFTLSWGNTGDGGATGVVVTDKLPGDSGLDWSIVGSTGSGSTCSIAGATGSQVLTCDVGAVAGNTAVAGTVHVTSGTTAATCGSVDNTGHIASTNDGSGDDSASMTVTCPDVAVEKVARDATVFVGGTALFEITVTNVGTGTAHGVVLTDPLPGGLDWQTASAGCSIAAGTLTCAVGDLAPKASFVATVSANTDTQAPDSDDCHVLDNTATVSADNEPAGATGNNESSASITVTCVSDLSIQKSVAGNTGGTDPDLHVPAAKVGDTLTYTLAYSGAGPLHDVVITDDLPDGLAFVQGSACQVASDPLPCETANPDVVFIGIVGGLLTWQADELPDPATGSVTFKARVLAAAEGVAQPIVNTATIDSDETEPDSDTAAIAVLPPPLALTPPPTNTVTPVVGPGNPGFALMLILLAIAGVAGTLALVTPVPDRLRDRRR